MAGDDIVDAEWEEVPDNRGALHVSRPAPRDTRQQASSRRTDEAIDRSPWLSLDFWRSLPWFKAIGLIVGLFVIAAILNPVDDGNQASSSQDGQPAVSSVDGDAKQMLSDWSEAVTGKASTIGFTLVTGKGKPGEFCSSSPNGSMMNFGGQTLKPSRAHEYDFFGWLPETGDIGTLGKFMFDADKSVLLGHHLIAGNINTHRHHDIADMEMKVDIKAPGIVAIDGKRYHVCVP